MKKYIIIVILISALCVGSFNLGTFQRNTHSFYGLSEQIHFAYIRHYTELNNVGTSNEGRFNPFKYEFIDFKVQVSSDLPEEEKCIIDDFLPDRKLTYTYQKRLFWIIPMSRKVTYTCYSV